MNTSFWPWVVKCAVHFGTGHESSPCAPSFGEGKGGCVGKGWRGGRVKVRVCLCASVLVAGWVKVFERKKQMEIRVEPISPPLYQGVEIVFALCFGGVREFVTCGG